MEQTIAAPAAPAFHHPAAAATAPARAPVVASAHRHVKIAYRPEIDGLRALAVVPVILFHLGAAWIPGGNLGVDVFFVISGFLITSIVRGELESGRFAFRHFWARRIRRIVPAMCAMTAAAMLFTYLQIFGADQPAIAKQALAGLFSVANLYFKNMAGDYWALTEGRSAFLHTWSLSVEEQFYIFFPPAMWLISRFARRHLPSAFAVLMGLSFAFFLWMMKHHPQGAFYLLPSRAWELAAGCFIASLRQPTALGRAGPLGFVGLGLVLLAYGFMPQMGWGNVLAVVGACLIIRFGHAGPLRRLLSIKPLLYVGWISYSLYLWHWPVIVFNGSLARPASTLTLVAVMLGLSVLSYVFVERPTRRARHAVPLSLVAFACTAGFTTFVLRGYRKPDVHEFDRPSSGILYYDCNPVPRTAENRMSSVDMPIRSHPADAYLHGGFIVGAEASGHATPDIVLLGDSIGGTWAGTIESIARDAHATVAIWTMIGTSPFFDVPASSRNNFGQLTPDQKLKYDEARIRLIAEWKPKVVIVAARWSDPREGDPAAMGRYLSQNAGHVLLMEQAPEIAIGSHNAIEHFAFIGLKPREDDVQYFAIGNNATVDAGRERVRGLASHFPNCEVVPTFDFYDRGTSAPVLHGRKAIYLDEDHLSDFGTSLMRAKLGEIITPYLREPTTRP